MPVSLPLGLADGDAELLEDSERVADGDCEAAMDGAGLCVEVR